MKRSIVGIWIPHYIFPISYVAIVSTWTAVLAIKDYNYRMSTSSTVFLLANLYNCLNQIYRPVAEKACLNTFRNVSKRG